MAWFAFRNFNNFRILSVETFQGNFCTICPRFKISGSFIWIESALKLKSLRSFIRIHGYLLEIWDLELAKKCMQHARPHLTERMNMEARSGQNKYLFYTCQWT